MMLKVQKRLAAQILKCSPKRVKFDEDRLDEIKEAITKADIKSLIQDKAISKISKKGTSRVRIRHNLVQKSKGLRKGPGSMKGKKTARRPRKRTWINKIRKQRTFLKELKNKKIISSVVFKDVIKKAKGDFFRSRRHIKLYLEEHRLFQATADTRTDKKLDTRKKNESDVKTANKSESKKRIIAKEILKTDEKNNVDAMKLDELKKTKKADKDVNA
jgi:large subunit ribosomal protein L19e